MPHSLDRVILALGVSFLVAGQLDAQQQDQHERRGFWVGAGAGWGGVGSSCPGCTSRLVNGPSGYLRLGTALGRNFLIGAEVSGWSITIDPVEQSVGVIDLAVHWYPSATGGFHFRLGPGWLGYRHYNRSTLVETTQQATAVVVGAGFDMRVSRNVSLVPFLNLYGTSETEREVNGVPTGSGLTSTMTMVQFGAGLTLH